MGEKEMQKDRVEEEKDESGKGTAIKHNFKMGHRVQCYYPVLGTKSAERAFGVVEQVNDNGSLDIAFDMGRQCKGINPEWCNSLSTRQEIAHERKKRIAEDQAK